VTRRKWILVTLTSSAAAIAGEPWKKKPSSWSEKDVDAILNRSPWAKAGIVEFQVGDIGKGPPRGSVAAPPPPNGASELPGGSGNRQMAANPIGGAPVGRGGIPAEVSDLPKFQAVVRWESAIPIRRARKAEDAAPAPPNRYIISVSGFPMMPRRTEGGNPEADIKELTYLEWPGKVPLSPSSLEIRRGGVLFFTFDAGSNPITDADHEVLFTMGTGSLQTRVRFYPKEMIYEGKLTL
jgi:hypothetical protein